MLSSALCYNISTALYASSILASIINLPLMRARFRRMVTIAVSIGFMCQTLGMLLRWAEAGDVEVAALERANGMVLTGLARFIVYTQHPPWSNLYEIMVFMSWGIILVFLVSEVTWRVKLLDIAALILALTAIGMASLTDGMIKPLVPALKSWWIMIHVISASTAYACGSLAAVASLLYLLRASGKISPARVASYTMLISAFLCFLLGKRTHLFTTLSYPVKLLKEMNGEYIVVQSIVENNMTPAFVSSPGVGILLLLSIILCVIASIVLVIMPAKAGIQSYTLAFIATVMTVCLIVFNDLTYTNYIPPSTNTLLMPPAPWRLGLQSNSWDLGLFFIILVGQIIVGYALWKPARLQQLLPQEDRLDHVAYSFIIISFFLMAVVLMTGALWAHYAWGRYWAWDPKETGALMIFITNAIYLHTRITHGWAGVPSAVIGIFGFFVILAGFLGVNLGLFADGLHSYGSS